MLCVYTCMYVLCTSGWKQVNGPINKQAHNTIVYCPKANSSGANYKQSTTHSIPWVFFFTVHSLHILNTNAQCTYTVKGLHGKQNLGKFFFVS